MTKRQTNQKTCTWYNICESQENSRLLNPFHLFCFKQNFIYSNHLKLLIFEIFFCFCFIFKYFLGVVKSFSVYKRKRKWLFCLLAYLLLQVTIKCYFSVMFLPIILCCSKEWKKNLNWVLFQYNRYIPYFKYCNE